MWSFCLRSVLRLVRVWRGILLLLSRSIAFSVSLSLVDVEEKFKLFIWFLNFMELDGIVSGSL